MDQEVDRMLMEADRMKAEAEKNREEVHACYTLVKSYEEDFKQNQNELETMQKKYMNHLSIVQTQLGSSIDIPPFDTTVRATPSQFQEEKTIPAPKRTKRGSKRSK